MADESGGVGKHIDYFDFLRLFAMCCVVFMHTTSESLQGLGGMDWRWELVNVGTSLAFTAVPLFLMMSGYLLCAGERTADIGLLLKKRLPRLAVPLVVWTLIAALRVCVLEDTLTPQAFFPKLIDAFGTPVAVHFWYMYLMLALYVLSPLLYALLHGLNRQGHCFMLGLIGLITLHAMVVTLLPAHLDRVVNFDLLWRLRFFDGHLYTFVLGYYLGRMERKIPNRILISAALALWAIIAVGTHVLSRPSGFCVGDFLYQSAGFEVMLAGSIFLLFKQNLKFRLRPHGELRALVALSMPVYLMHNILLSIFHDFGYYPSGLLSLIAMMLLNVLICYLFLKTVATIPLLCYAITGMSWRTACESCNWVYTWRGIRERMRSRGK